QGSGGGRRFPGCFPTAYGYERRGLMHGSGCTGRQGVHARHRKTQPGRWIAQISTFHHFQQRASKEVGEDVHLYPPSLLMKESRLGEVGATYMLSLPTYLPLAALQAQVVDVESRLTAGFNGARRDMEDFKTEMRDFQTSFLKAINDGMENLLTEKQAVEDAMTTTTGVCDNLERKITAGRDDS
ncbi:hypothetical protein THAOC_03548, partial [Thalassiosira oceanica]